MATRPIEFIEWHLITSEYPPQIGGVSDYAYLLSAALAAAGDSVQVWCPPSSGSTPEAGGVIVHRELGRIAPADLRRVSRLLKNFQPPRRLLVQWVPHGYGYKSMNLAFCLWLWKRAAVDRDTIELMVHEPYLPFREGSFKQDAAAVVHRLMTIVLLNAVKRVWISVPAWESRLRPYALGRRLDYNWLPIPSTVPAIDDESGVSATRSRYVTGEGLLLGHFGPYVRQSSDVIASLLPPLLLNRGNLSLLLLGKGSESLRNRLAGAHRDLAPRIHATGVLPVEDLSRHLSACDVIIQPYPDGVSSRRTSVMVALSHGLPIVTTSGRQTESLWAESNAVLLASVGDVASMSRLIERLLEDKCERKRMGVAARLLYQDRFDMRATVAALREAQIGV